MIQTLLCTCFVLCALNPLHGQALFQVSFWWWHATALTLARKAVRVFVLFWPPDASVFIFEVSLRWWSVMITDKWECQGVVCFSFFFLHLIESLPTLPEGRRDPLTNYHSVEAQHAYPSANIYLIGHIDIWSAPGTLSEREINLAQGDTQSWQPFNLNMGHNQLRCTCLSYVDGEVKENGKYMSWKEREKQIEKQINNC